MTATCVIIQETMLSTRDAGASDAGISPEGETCKALTKKYYGVNSLMFKSVFEMTTI